MSSSLQEFYDNPYSKSKRERSEFLMIGRIKTGAMFTGLIIPDIFGPF